MQIKLIGCILLCYSGIILADNVTVYRWVDENNVVHFSQNQPEHDNYTELTMTNVVKSKQKEDDGGGTKGEVEEPLALTPSTEKCEEAKANVRMINAYDKIQYTDPQGNVLVLNKQEKSQQLEINTKLVEVYCGQ